MFFFVVIVASGLAVAVATYYLYYEPSTRSKVGRTRRSRSCGSIRIPPSNVQSPLSSASSTNFVNHVKTPIPGSRATRIPADGFGSPTSPAKSPTLTLISCRDCTSPVASPGVGGANSTTSARRRRIRRSTSASSAGTLSTVLTPAVSRLSVCDCRLSEDGDEIVRDDESVATSTDELHFRAAHTKIMPIQFNRYTPLDLTKMTEKDIRQGLCENACDEVLADTKQTILTPFRPILNSVVYAAKHAFLLSELVNEYEYTDS